MAAPQTDGDRREAIDFIKTGLITSNQTFSGILDGEGMNSYAQVCILSRASVMETNKVQSPFVIMAPPESIFVRNRENRIVGMTYKSWTAKQAELKFITALSEARVRGCNGVVSCEAGSMFLLLPAYNLDAKGVYFSGAPITYPTGTANTPEKRAFCTSVIHYIEGALSANAIKISDLASAAREVFKSSSDFTAAQIKQVTDVLDRKQYTATIRAEFTILSTASDVPTTLTGFCLSAALFSGGGIALQDLVALPSFGSLGRTRVLKLLARVKADVPCLVIQGKLYQDDAKNDLVKKTIESLNDADQILGFNQVAGATTFDELSLTTQVFVTTSGTIYSESKKRAGAGLASTAVRKIASPKLLTGAYVKNLLNCIPARGASTGAPPVVAGGAAEGGDLGNLAATLL